MTTYNTDAELKAAIRALHPSLTFKKTEDGGEYRISVSPEALATFLKLSHRDAIAKNEAIAAHVDAARWGDKAMKAEARADAYAAAQTQLAWYNAETAKA